ncbi:transmembrane protein 87A-like [Pseudonaja textilis]|uniref:transmembrane protein 87A-like n=1 Tax=Pseudonaja textilis TaxID=8673 RepID=UPI000EA9FF37|nr:transmembrane protein 87A-like [Pseudonaja textilis]
MAAGCGARRWRLLPLLLLAGAALAPGPAGGVASEPGRWSRTAGGNQKKLFVFSKTMFKGTWIILKFPHEVCEDREVLNVTWYLRSSRCHNEAYINENEALTYLSNPDVEASVLGGGQYIWNVTLVQCGQLHKLSVQELPVPKKLKHLPVKETSVQKREAPKEAEVKGAQEKGSNPPNQEAQNFC